MADITDLLLPITLDSWREFELDTAALLGLPTTAWRAQTPERVLIEIDCRGLGILGATVNPIIRGGFLEYAEGFWLTLRAEDTYNTTRKTATFASAQVTFTGSSGTPYSIPAGDRVIVKKTGTDITYAVPGPFTIPGSGSVSLNDNGDPLIAVCEVPGTAGNAAAGDISEMQDALPGASVTSTTTAVGIDEEADQDLRVRARLATGPTSPAGPLAAYEYVATTALRADGNPVDVTKVLVKEDVSTGSVIAYYASASGGSVDVGLNVNPDPGTVNYAILRSVRPQGVDYAGYTATVLTSSVTYIAGIRSKVLKAMGLTVQDVKDRINEYVVNYVASTDLPIEGFPLPSPIPGYVGVLPAQDIADLIGEAVRLGSDIEAGVAGQKLVYAITVSTGDILYQEGEVLALASPGPGVLPVDGTLVEV